MRTSQNNVKTVLCLLLCALLVATLAFGLTGCKEQAEETPKDIAVSAAPVTHQKGEGATEFTFEVTDANGNFTQFQIHTDKTTVGEALQEVGLIAGEEGPYGLYVKTVNGITLDYDKDGLYWAFYVNGEYATAGVDKTEIDTGAVYMFKAVK